MPTQTPAPVGARIFNEIERQALYDIITARRDVRNEFLPKPIDAAVLRRILEAAHAAPSVGFMQPWNFILIDSPNQKKLVHKAFSEENEEAIAMFPSEKQAAYRALTGC